MDWHYLLLTTAIVTLAFLIAWPFLRSRRRKIGQIVNRWVEENGFELVAYEERLFSPFTLRKSNSQVAVLVELKDDAGRQKRCWLKLGDWLTGLSSYQVQCEWVE